MVELLENPSIAQEVIKGAQIEHGGKDFSREEEKLKNKVYGLQGRLNALTERLSELPAEVDATPIYQQMKKIAEDKRELEARIVEVKRKGQAIEMPAELADYGRFVEMLRVEAFKAMTAQLKQKVLSKLVEKVEMLPEGLRIHFIVSASKIKKGMDKTSPIFNFADRCSTSLTNGGTNRT